MRYRTPAVAIGLCLVAVATVGATRAAQRTRRRAPASAARASRPQTVQRPPVVDAVPVEREPQHHPVFENAYVRVLDVQLPPGYVSLFHVHSNDNVSVRIATGPTRVDLPGRDGQVQTPPVGRVVFNSASPPYTHRVANLGTTPIHIIDIDLLAHALSQASSVDDDLGGHEVVIDNDRVRVSRVTLAPGALAPAHTHRRSWLSVVVRGAAPGSFAWHGAGSLATVREPEVVEIEVK